ncbi:isochorismate synthase [Flavobacterium tegetincola]|uniref:isochorismate synthase n=1 Tax=Flavobacterium tegetincola TaxID=150172 RepID=UPI00047BF478|nr:isochorismate synthase [Flavobacterium tegetincola]
MPNIFEQSLESFQKNLPFVLYSKPDSEHLIGFFQQDRALHKATTFAEKGFVFADFEGNQSVLFPEMACEIQTEKYKFDCEKSKDTFVSSSTDGKEAFEVLVEEGIKAIDKGTFQKVVLSRSEAIQVNDFNFLQVFKKMLSAYPTAFRYVWFHPEIGMWLGASPEQLLKVKSSKFKTVALAGTQKYESDVEAIWHEKEKQEQQFVADFIIASLDSEVSAMEISQPYTFQAGSLVHLKTDIEGVFKNDFNLMKVVQVLHPTPAVCGLPKESSKAFILENEGYDRRFYAGFLGELNWDVLPERTCDSDFFVNLRCMEIQQNQVQLYIGCGITKDSNPEKEYFETANKAMTMKKILN